ncbi:hypothetical protein [Silvibacterium sp.]|uniref:hypothetical protein n=1 Tax=Silvibacterium sp. TaxID=1964179 RepID=UPI0039E27A63
MSVLVSAFVSVLAAFPELSALPVLPTTFPAGEESFPDCSETRLESSIAALPDIAEELAAVDVDPEDIATADAAGAVDLNSLASEVIASCAMLSDPE